MQSLKISDVSQKTDCDATVLDLEKKVTDYDHDKYISTSEFNNLTAKDFTARLAQAYLITKTDFDTKLMTLNRKINSKKKHVLVENKYKKLQTFDSSCFQSKSHFVENDNTLINLIFQPIDRYFKRIIGDGSNEYIYFWQSKGLSDERIKSITTSNYNITPKLSYFCKNKTQWKLFKTR